MLVYNESKLCLITGKTLKINSKETATTEPKDATAEPKGSFLHPCLACGKDGATNLEVVKHPMATCEVWNSLSFADKKKLVNCVKHPFAKTHKTENCKSNIRPCQSCQKTNHHHLLCIKRTAKSNKASCKSKSSSSSNPEVLLKTLFIKGKDPKQILGVIEDNCSTDNYITYDKAEEMKLKGEDITLEIEGINATEVIESKVYQVPIRDKKKNLHIVECYGLKEITKDTTVPDMENYKKLCNSFGIKINEVKRPRKIDLMISAKVII